MSWRCGLSASKVHCSTEHEFDKLKHLLGYIMKYPKLRVVVKGDKLWKEGKSFMNKIFEYNIYYNTLGSIDWYIYHLPFILFGPDTLHDYFNQKLKCFISNVLDPNYMNGICIQMILLTCY